MPEEAVEIEASLAKLAEARQGMLRELSKVIIGQAEVLKQILASIFSSGHCLLVGVPGLAKTLMVRSVAQILALDFKRIQFTPDLMPADITGTYIIQPGREGKREFRFVRGPIFAHIILADEINRTPPKTQAALLEAMQERQVTVGSTTYDLPRPFFVIATQNPIEQEGTYPLPEAQLDRFMFNVQVGYPQHEEEVDIYLATAGGPPPRLQPLLSGEEILTIQRVVREIAVPTTRRAWCGPRGRRNPPPRISSSAASSGAPGRAPGSTCCWAPRPWPRWTTA